VGAIDAAGLDPFRKKLKKSLLYFGCDFSVWYNCGKMIKIVATRCHILKLKCTKFDNGWGPPQTPLGELTALHQTP